MADSVLRSFKKVVTSPDAAPPIAPYSPGIIANGMLFMSGQIGILPSGDIIPGGIEAETRQALRNMGDLLSAAGASYSHVVKATVLLADYSEFADMNRVYAQFFHEDPPARACYQVGALPKNCRIEIEAIAVLGRKDY